MEKQKAKETEMELGQEFLQHQGPENTMAKEYWQRFAKSGSIMDYLKYSAVSRGEVLPEDIK